MEGGCGAIGIGKLSFNVMGGVTGGVEYIPRSGHSHAKGGTYDRSSNKKMTPFTDYY